MKFGTIERFAGLLLVQNKPQADSIGRARPKRKHIKVLMAGLPKNVSFDGEFKNSMPTEDFGKTITKRTARRDLNATRDTRRHRHRSTSDKSISPGRYLS